MADKFSPFQLEVVPRVHDLNGDTATLTDTTLVEVEPLEDISHIYENGWTNVYGRLDKRLRAQRQEAVKLPS